jgi:hypothetical protein
VADRGSTLNLAASLLAFLVFMVVLLTIVGSGVGMVELLVWLALLAVGARLIVRRYRLATRPR